MHGLYLLMLLAPRGVFPPAPPYVVAQQDATTWLVQGPAFPGGLLAYSLNEAQATACVLNEADRCADRRDFNGDGFVNSQDLFDFIAEMPQGTP